MNQNLPGEHRKNWDVLSIFQHLYQQQSISMLFILIIMWVILSLLSPYFFTVNNLFEITLQSAVIALIAAGESFVIFSGLIYRWVRFCLFGNCWRLALQFKWKRNRVFNGINWSGTFAGL